MIEQPDAEPAIPKTPALAASVSGMKAASPAPPADAQHLRTDHLLDNLKHRTISSGFVTIASQGMKFVLTLGSTMVLARLLTPRDFGLIAMVTTVTGFLRVFKDFGLSTATVQRETITEAQVSNLFWINVAVSGALSLTVASLAPVVAWFYREPRLVAVTLVLSTTFLFSGSAVQHLALLNRQMRFKEIAVIEVGSMLVGVACGVGMALGNFGYWALVMSSVAMEGAAVVFTWSLSRWRPQWPLFHSGTRSFVRFGVSLTLAGFVNCISKNVDSTLLGRFYGADALGIYSRAMALLIRPLDQFLTPVTTVLESTLARIQGDPERYRRTFLQIYNAMAMVGFVGTGLLLALSRPVTLVLLGAKWEKASVIFAGFAGMALYAPLASALGFLLISQGRGRDLLFVSIISNVAVVAGVAAGLPFGPAGVAIGWSVVCLCCAMPYTYYVVGREGPVHARDLWLVFAKHLPLWFVVIGATWAALQLVKNLHPLLQLLICLPAGLAAAAAVIFSFPYTRQNAFQILDIMLEYRARPRKTN